MATCLEGIGTTACQPMSCGSGSGISTGTGLSTAGAVANAGFAAEGAASSRSDRAQQRSASAWLTARVEPSSGASDLCIGHGSWPEQHVMRASAVGIHPAQTPA